MTIGIDSLVCLRGPVSRQAGMNAASHADVMKLSMTVVILMGAGSSALAQDKGEPKFERSAALAQLEIAAAATGAGTMEGLQEESGCCGGFL